MERQRSKFLRDLLRSFVITDCYKILKLLGICQVYFFLKQKVVLFYVIGSSLY